MNSSQQPLSRLQGMQEEDGDEAVVGTAGDGEDFVGDFLPDPLDDEVVDLFVSGQLLVTCYPAQIEEVRNSRAWLTMKMKYESK